MEAEHAHGWDEADEVQISAIEHYSYCPRQCALIHVEGTYDENIFTTRGTLAHERAHSGEETPNRGVPTARNVPLWSERLGIRGRADVVELPPSGPYPVEYKVGKRHGAHADLQLCAQALCLEEMLGVAIPHGAIYYHATRRRHEVALDGALRGRTLAAIGAVRAMLRAQKLPDAPNDERCPNCSLIKACLPSVVGEPARMRGLDQALWMRYDAGGGDV